MLQSQHLAGSQHCGHHSAAVQLPFAALGAKLEVLDERVHVLHPSKDDRLLADNVRMLRLAQIADANAVCVKAAAMTELSAAQAEHEQ